MLLSVLLAELVDGNRKLLAEELQAAQHTGIEEVHLGEDIKGVILQGSTAHTKPVFGLQETGRLGDLAARVLDGLGFIEYCIVEGHFEQQLDITAQSAIGR